MRREPRCVVSPRPCARDRVWTVRGGSVTVVSDVPGSAPPAIDVGPGPAVRATEPGDRRSTARRWVRTHLVDGGLVAVVTLTIFPSLVRYPLAGVDAGYTAGLNLAHEQAMMFGSDIVFTYGPWGFLAFPFMYGSRPWLLMVLVALSSRALLVALSYALLRRSLNRGWAFGVLLVGLPPLLPQHIVFIAIGVTGGMLLVLAGARLPWGWLVAAGLYTAFVGMVKIDSATICLAVLGLASMASCWSCGSWTDAAGGAARRVGVFLGSLAGGGLVMWLVAGQAASDLVPFVRGSIAASTGFASSMGAEDPERGLEYLFAAALASGALVLLALARDTDRRLRLALAVFAVVVLYLVFRQGFTRHDMHAVAFFVPVVFLVGGLLPVVGWRRTLPLGLAALVACHVVSGLAFTTRLRVDERIESATRTAEYASSSSKRSTFLAEGRERLRGLYALDPGLVDRLRGETVHVSPHETSIAWAYPDLVWSPLPVFQEYTAYEAALDDLNADRYGSDTEAPRFVLRQPGVSVDDRWSRWESPAASLALLCTYSVTEEADGWVVAERGVDRCGAPRSVATGSVRFGEPIELPEVGPGEVLVGRFTGVNRSFVDRLRTSLFKAPVYEVLGDDGVRHRFVPDTQSQWHLLSSDPCAARLLDGAQSWQTTSLTFTAGGRSIGEPDIGYELAVVPFTCT